MKRGEERSDSFPSLPHLDLIWDTVDKKSVLGEEVSSEREYNILFRIELIKSLHYYHIYLQYILLVCLFANLKMYHNFLQIMLVGEGISGALVVFSLVVGGFLFILLRDFLTSIVPIKKNIFTHLDNMFVTMAMIRIVSVSKLQSPLQF